MRIGSTVLLHNQRCVQSYQWNSLRPLGELQGVLDSLEEYQCDEVAVIRPVRKNDTAEKFEADINVLHRLTTMTPISFGGGIRTIEHLDLLSDLPVERLVFSSPFLSNQDKLLAKATSLFGHQAIQCLLPIRQREGCLEVYCSDRAKFVAQEMIDFNFVQAYANEVILLDVANEGRTNKFDFDLLKYVPIDRNKLIICGGVGHESVKTAKKQGLASVLIDNKVLHKEYSIASYKHAVNLL